MKQLALTLLTIVLVAVPTFGQLPTKIENTRIQDHAQVLSPEQEASLQAKTDSLKASKDIDLGVVLVRTTNGTAPVDFTTQIGRTYGIGSAEGEHRGIVFLLAIDDRKCWIQPSRHIEYAYTDGAMGELCRGARSLLKAQDYNGAVNQITDQLIAKSGAVDAQQAVGVVSDQQSTPSGSGGGGTILGVLGVIVLFGGFIGLVAFLISKRNQRIREAQEALEEEQRQERLRLARIKREQEQEAERVRLEKERKAREAYLKTPEGIAETKRLEEERRRQEAIRAERARLAAIEEKERKRKYAIWAASPAGIAALALAAKQKKEEEERRRREEKEAAARRKREEEEEEERRARRRRSENSSYGGGFASSYGGSSSSSDSSSSGGGGDFGGGGGGGDW